MLASAAIGSGAVPPLVVQPTAPSNKRPRQALIRFMFTLLRGLGPPWSKGPWPHGSVFLVDLGAAARGDLLARNRAVDQLHGLHHGRLLWRRAFALSVGLDRTCSSEGRSDSCSGDSLLLVHVFPLFRCAPSFGAVLFDAVSIASRIGQSLAGPDPEHCETSCSSAASKERRTLTFSWISRILPWAFARTSAQVVVGETRIASRSSSFSA